MSAVFTGTPTASAAKVDGRRLKALLAHEMERFVRMHPTSKRLFDEAQHALLGGVPMNWMRRSPGPFPIFVESAAGARFRDVDGHEYVDFCLGDTGAMTGHAHPPTTLALARQAARGITMMLPTADAAAVAEELRRRFRVPKWQIAMSATDANRFSLRLARHATGRPKVLVFNWCYHGTVDEALAVLDGGRVVSRPGHIGPPVDPATTTKVVEMNDVAALRAALAPRDVALVLMEPAMTNIGIVLPAPGFLEEVRRVTRETGTLLLIDETHTICCGPGGYTAAAGLEPDIVVIGKPIGGGMPGAAYGFTDAVAASVARATGGDACDVSGIGGTLTANALALAAMRATLESTLRAEDFARMNVLADRWTRGVADVIREHRLPWSVTRLGCRAEYWFCPQPPANGGEAADAHDMDLDRFMHLWAMNAGVSLTWFHLMGLMCPATTVADVDAHTAAFRSAVEVLLGRREPEPLPAAGAGAGGRAKL
jgi:glutamate-1-semialdehyde 2,1-aminomutase